MNSPAASISPGDAALMREAIGKIATGPEYSRDLDFETARDAMALVLDGRVDPVQSAVFLVALRMKRESEDENLGMLAALQAVQLTAVAPVSELIDVSDPYDGYAKGLPAGPFLPALLAACGLAAVCHGAWSTGPKHGLTHAQIIAACGGPIALEPGPAAELVGHADVGWAYLDQSRSSPALHALAPLRELIVKRPALSTIEKLLRPLRGESQTHLLSGYVHVAYPPVYMRLAQAAGFDSALVVRGMEGGVLPSLRQPGKAMRYTASTPPSELNVAPADAGIDQPERMPPLPAGEKQPSAVAAAEAGRRALAGEAGPMHDALVYGAALALWHVGRAPDLGAGARQAREVLSSGAGLARFEAFGR